MKFPNWNEPIIHVRTYDYNPCRVAIVTGVSHNPAMLFVHVFSLRGDGSTAVVSDGAWHSLEDCDSPNWQRYDELMTEKE